MLNSAVLATALAGLVGWHPATENNAAGELHLPDQLLASRSGLFVNDLSELLGLEVLVHCVPRGQQLDAWLQRLTDDALLRLTSRLAQSQSLDAKVLLPDTSLLNGPGRATDTINKQGRFVGIRLQPTNKPGVAYSVPAMALQLDAVLSAPLNIYAFSPAAPEPVIVATVAAGANKPYYPFIFPLLADAKLSFGATDAGQLAYIGYYENDLEGAHAIARDFSGGPCFCAGDTYTQWGEHARARAFSVSADRLLPDGTFSPIAANSVTLEGRTHGLNLYLSAVCDVASALKTPENQLRLAESVQLALGCRFLEALIASPNITQVTSRADLQADAYALLTQFQAHLYGGKDLSTEKDYYPSLLKAVKLDFSGLHADCLPKQATGISVGRLVR